MFNYSSNDIVFASKIYNDIIEYKYEFEKILRTSGLWNKFWHQREGQRHGGSFSIDSTLVIKDECIEFGGEISCCGDSHAYVTFLVPLEIFIDPAKDDNLAKLDVFLQKQQDERNKAWAERDARLKEEQRLVQEQREKEQYEKLKTKFEQHGGD